MKIVKWRLVIGIVAALASPHVFAETGVQLPAGTYKGIVQEFNDPNSAVAGDVVNAGEFFVEDNGALNFTTPDGADLRFPWRQDHWYWEYSEAGTVRAEPRKVGVFYVVEYVAFENQERVGHAQIFLVREP